MTALYTNSTECTNFHKQYVLVAQHAIDCGEIQMVAFDFLSVYASNSNRSRIGHCFGLRDTLFSKKTPKSQLPPSQFYLTPLLA